MNIYHYRVQANDTPASIAQKFTGSQDAAALIAANPQKPKVLVDGHITFQYLTAGENIILPRGWVPKLVLQRETLTNLSPTPNIIFPTHDCEPSWNCPSEYCPTYTVCWFGNKPRNRQ